MKTSPHVPARSPLYPVYAENARPASGADLSQKCVVCSWRPTERERVADLPGGGIAHVTGCIARAYLGETGD